MIPKSCPICSRHFYKKFPKQRICLACLNKKKSAKRKVLEDEACQLLQKLPEGYPKPIAPGFSQSMADFLDRVDDRPLEEQLRK